MKRYLQAGRGALVAGQHYAALVMALTAPDVCASFENPGPGKSHQRYVAWCDKWLIPKFTSTRGPFQKKHIAINAEEIFQLRCSLIHQGSGQVHPEKGGRHRAYEFFDDSIGAHMNELVVNGASLMTLNAASFCKDMYESVEEWDAWSDTVPELLEAKKSLLTIRSAGWSFHGIHFLGNAPEPPESC